MARVGQAKAEKLFNPEEIDLGQDLDALILEASAYKNMAPYFGWLAKQVGKPIANLRSRYNYLRRQVDDPPAEPVRRGRPRKTEPGPEGELIQLFAEVFRVKPSRETVAILRDCIARHGIPRVAMAMERVRPEGGEVFARAIAVELGKR